MAVMPFPTKIMAMILYRVIAQSAFFVYIAILRLFSFLRIVQYNDL